MPLPETGRLLKAESVRGLGSKVVFNFDAIGFILGLGYVMGLRSSMILCAGGVLSNFVLVPLIAYIEQTSCATSQSSESPLVVFGSRNAPARADHAPRVKSAATPQV